MPTEPSGKKSKNKKSGKNKAFIILDGVSTADMTKEQLEEHVKRLKEELDKEREERNYFQLEKDQVSAYFEIAKTQLEQKNAVIRNKERELEDATEKHHTELKAYKQKVKHLMYEHQNNITEARADTMVALKIAGDEHASENKEEWRRRQEMLAGANDKQIRHENSVKHLKSKYEDEMSTMRREFERLSTEAEQRYERKMKNTREEMDVVRRTELTGLEERKNKHIDALMQAHEEAFRDIKNYYNDVTINNLALINTLKDSMKDLEKKDERMEKRMTELEEEKRVLKEPLERVSTECKELQGKLSGYHKDKATMQTTKSRLRKTEEGLKSCEWELEVTKQKFMQVEKERDDLYGRFVSAINEVQQKTGLKNVLLERKLACIHTDLEKKEAQLKSVLAGREGSEGNVTQRVDDVIDLKNSAIESLKYEIARLCKAHNDMVNTYESKLGEFGVDKGEFGFKPFRATSHDVDVGKLRKGPAGLVSAF